MTYFDIPATSTPAENFKGDKIGGSIFSRIKPVLGGEDVATEWLAGNGAAANGARVALSTEDQALLTALQRLATREYNVAGSVRCR